MPSRDVDLAPGALLVSAPMMQDPNFRRAVVLLCEHQPEQGTFGLILNQPVDVQLGDVVEGVFAYDPPLHLGGPVQRDTLHFLHRRPDDIPGGIELPGSITWGGDFEAVQETARRGDASPEDLRFFVGYAGWSPGQLEEEFEEDAWILAPGSADVIFSASPDELWRSVLRRMGGQYAMLANFPDDPRMN
jgi:putative transcriptional regulator